VSEPSPILRVEGLRVETQAGTEIVQEISLEVGRGEVLSLVGESGCGKTTTALALLGHARPGTRIASGSVWLEGEDVLGMTPQRLRKVRGSRISYVPQDPTSGLSPRHRVGAQIVEALVVHGSGAGAAHAICRELAARVGLPSDREFLRRYPFELSGGQQQRVAIAMALACKPVVVVLDEPTTGLDVTTQAQVLALLRDLGAETGAAFVYVTHDLAVVDNLADRVAVMYSGRIVELGPRGPVLRRPAHPYTTLLICSVPRLAFRQQLVGIAGTAPPPGHRPAGCFFAPRCPLADERCRAEFPPETEVEAAHSVRCWRASELQPAVAARTSRNGRPPARAPALLEAEEVSASFGRGPRCRTVLHGVSLSIRPGECLALVGESGSGKTTLGRCIAGLHRPDSGSVRLNGEPLALWVGDRTQDQRRAIQIVFQNPDRSLNPSETVALAIERPLRLFDQTAPIASRREAAQLLERVRLPVSKLDRYPRELSGGEKQRVAIARALAARPSLLVCDEISSALDVSIQAAIVALLEELRADDLALLFITHNLALVNSVASQVLVLEDGEIREHGSTAEVIERPTHVYTRELIAAVPELGAREET
jgi:oligopeptide/dipeptide ABC transporter ATP-binding protein